MYKGMYDCFAHWFHDGRGTVYFYSDPHFSDTEMEHLRKDYIGDEEQVKRINSKIGKYDTLVILGDVGDPTWIKKLRGYKVLIMGNHDVGATKYKEYFDEVYEGMLIISEKVILSHEPIDVPGMWNICGHDHSNWHCMDRQTNCCAEHIAYTPIPWKFIHESGVLGAIPSLHRMTIDTATVRKKRREKT